MLPPHPARVRALIQSQIGPPAGRALIALLAGREITVAPLHSAPEAPLATPPSARRQSVVVEKLGASRTTRTGTTPRCALGRASSSAAPNPSKDVSTGSHRGRGKGLGEAQLGDLRLHGVSEGDKRQIELVAMNFPLDGGIPLACDITFVSPLTAKGEARRRTARMASPSARPRRTKEKRTRNWSTRPGAVGGLRRGLACPNVGGGACWRFQCKMPWPLL